MELSGIHQGTMRMYGGFIFKQWKKRFLLLTGEGNLLVSHDASSLPEKLVMLHSGCEAIVEGKEILDLPKLPPGGSRDCCFALILPQSKYLLLMADAPEICSQWLNILRKVRESVSSHASLCRKHQVPPLALKNMVPEQIPDKDPSTPPVTRAEVSSTGPLTCNSPRDKSRSAQCSKHFKGAVHPVGCLRHGTISNAQTMKAVYLLMGGAAASSAMGYLGACTPSNLDAKAPDMPINANFSDLGQTGSYHTGSPAISSPHFNSFDFEVADADFDAFDCGGFTF